MSNQPSPTDEPADPAVAEVPAGPVENAAEKDAAKKVVLAREPSTLDPTRYGDWEKNGRCIDF